MISFGAAYRNLESAGSRAVDTPTSDRTKFGSEVLTVPPSTHPGPD